MINNKYVYLTKKYYLRKINIIAILLIFAFFPIFANEYSESEESIESSSYHVSINGFNEDTDLESGKSIRSLSGHSNNS